MFAIWTGFYSINARKTFKFQGYFLPLNFFKDLQFNSPHPQNWQNSDSLFVNQYADDENLIQITPFPIKLFGGKTKEALLTMYLVKTTMGFSCKWLRFIRQINRIQVYIENMLQRINSVSFDSKSEGDTESW